MTSDQSLQVPYASPAPQTWRVICLALEAVAVFIGVPLAFYLNIRPIHPIAAIVAVSVMAVAWLVQDRTFDRRLLWNVTPDFGAQLKRVLMLFVPSAIVIAGISYAMNAGHVFHLPRNHPFQWMAILLVYPILSVYPQELVYRSFFFQRYRPLLGDGWPMIIASTVVFSFMHIVFYNWLAVGFTLAGGLLFAWRYRATQSLLLVSIEHSLYGSLIFTVGLELYFFQGTALMLRQMEYFFR